MKEITFRFLLAGVWIIILLYLATSTQAASGLTEFEYPIVDWVKVGSLHWSSASGNIGDPDEDDIDNSFGEHNGSHSKYANWKIKDQSIKLKEGDSIEFDMRTQEPGTYVFSIHIASGQDIWQEASYKVGNQWIPLSPLAGQNEEKYRGAAYSWDVDIPEGQMMTRFRIATASSPGGGVIGWSVLKRKVNDLFTQAPVNGVHPRLLFREDELVQLRQRVQSGLPALFYEELLNDANGLNPSNTKWDAYDGFYENHGASRALLKIGLAWAISQDPKYLQKARDLMVRIGAWPTWNTKSTLAQADILSAYAICYDWIYNGLSDTDRETFARKISKEANEIDTKSHVGNFWSWDTRANNWRAVIESALGLSGLVLDNHIASHGWVVHATEEMHLHLDTMFGPSGGYGETAGYYAYATERFSEFASALRRNGGEDLFTYRDSVLKKSMLWLLDMTLPSDKMLYPAGDSGRVPIGGNVLAVLSSEYQSGLARWLFDRFYGTDETLHWLANNWPSRSLVQTLLNYNESIPIEDPDTLLPTTHVYAGAPDAFGYIFFRTSFGNRDALYVASQCGDDQGFHGHADHGAFLFSAYGQNLVDDMGLHPDHYGSLAWNWHKKSEAHNVILIDGKGQRWEGDAYLDLGDIVTWASTDAVSFVTMDSTLAYNYGWHPPEWIPIDHALRYLMLVRTGKDRGYVVVMDDVLKDSQPHDYDLRFHGMADAVDFSVVSPGHYLETATQADLHIYLAEPQDPTATIENQYDMDFIRLKKNAARGVFVSLLYPTSERLGVALPPIETIREGGVSGFHLGADVVVFNKSGTLQSGGGIESDGEAIFVREGNGVIALDGFLATRASLLAYQGVDYLRSDLPIAAAALDYTPRGASGEIDVGSASHVEIRLAYKPEAVLFNEGPVPFAYDNGFLMLDQLTKRGSLDVHFRPQDIDTDGDGVFDVVDTDDDNDGFTDAFEIERGTDPLDPSSFPDVVPPQITDISIQVRASNLAVISWITNEEAGSRVEYGLSAGYGSSMEDALLVREHTLSIMGLLPSSAYHYRVRSVDVAGNESVSDDLTFTTSAIPLHHNFTLRSCYAGTNANKACNTDSDCPSGKCLNSVVAWWPLDEASGARHAGPGGICESDCDLSDNNNVGRDPSNKMQGDASAGFTVADNNYLSCLGNTCDELALTSSATWGCWASFKDETSLNQMINKLRHHKGGYMMLRDWTPDTIDCRMDYNGGDTTAHGARDGMANFNTWYHAVCRFDDRADFLQPFINGKASGSGAAISNMEPSSVDFKLSSAWGGSHQITMNGQLDECFVHPDALTDEEICEICRFGLDGSHTDRAEQCGSCAYLSTPPSCSLADIDCNGSAADSSDIQLVVNVRLGLVTDQAIIQRADLNSDTKVDASDIQAIVNMSLGV